VFVATAVLSPVLFHGVGYAAQQFKGLCAIVKMEIPQELTLERVGFLATLEVTNNESTANITSFAAALTFESVPTGGAAAQDMSNMFFVKPPVIRGVSSIDGSGIIEPGETAVIEWFIIPKIAAGGSTPAGVRYNVGAKLAGSIFGMEIAPEVLAVIPDSINVRPEPQLDITYFQPRDVDGDDPFTPEISEAPIPFTLGVLVANEGFGRANDVRIVSEQPRIVENEQALILVAQLLGARVDDRPVDRTSLTLDLGDIEPGGCRKGSWEMMTSLSGTFIEFKARYTHASELGGRDTSLIKDLNAHFIVHEVLNDQPGRDGLKDFLADTLSAGLNHPGAALVPDTLFESDCSTLPVNTLPVPPANVSYDGNRVTTVLANAIVENWVFIQVDDPAQAKLPIANVVRSDGKVLNANNAWTSIRYTFEGNRKLTFLNILDFVDLGTYTYRVTYATPPTDTTPPQTTIRFQGDVEQLGGDYYVKPDTTIFFTADDASPTGIFYRFAGEPTFEPFVPFELPGPGSFVIEYFSRDNRGNEEAVKSATVVLSDGFPVVDDLAVSAAAIVNPGQAVSVRPTGATVSFTGGDSAITLDALLEVYRGVFAFPTLQGVPASPARASTAAIVVGGDNVDFYVYSVNNGVWSSERPVAQPIALGGLAGNVSLRVRGRATSGSYPDESAALEANWTVDGNADSIQVLGPATPTRSLAAELTVVNAASYCYRVDQGTYRPDSGNTITLANLAEGTHVVEVRRRSGAADPCPGNVPGTAFKWLVDRDYGTGLPPAARLLSKPFPDIAGTTVDFRWDGRDALGNVVPPGVYSVKVTITDALGRSTSAVTLVEVGDLISGDGVAPGVDGASQRAAHAVGDWAVWQDQRNGPWNVFALNLGAAGAAPVAVRPTTFNQQRPRTDGEYVVWEDRQADGSWDVWAKRLGSADAPFAVTQSPAIDERSPSIDWPWVVYKQKPVGSAGAPWQVSYVNLLTNERGAVDPSTADQLEPVVQGGRAVWEDRRDLGPGEIYFADLASHSVRRITTNAGGQIQPTIFDDWIVWADNRAGLQLDLFGFNLRRGVEAQLTATPQDEASPSLAGDWVAYTDDKANEDEVDLRLLDLTSLASVQLTNFESTKSGPSLAAGKLVWVDGRTGVDRVRIADMPDLQPVFDNNNAIVVTGTMVTEQHDAYTLLELWNREAGVTEVRRYSSLLPTPVSEAATWDGAASGTNFALEAGAFLWVEFGGNRILDLGNTDCSAVDLPAGVSALALTCFPDEFSAYRAIREIGASNVKALRALDARSGRWSVATVSPAGEPFGEDFAIPRVGVLLIDMQAPVAQWRPGAN
jgi:beta propeller repeat protein